MITTCDVAPVKKFPFLGWGQKCPIYKGLRQCASAPVPYYRSQISVALTQGLSPPKGRARALDSPQPRAKSAPVHRAVRNRRIKRETTRDRGTECGRTTDVGPDEIYGGNGGENSPRR